MRGAVHRILCIPRKLLETCRLRVRFCPAGIGRRLQRGGKQQKRRLAKSLTGHDCRDRHNSIGADYAESVHNSGTSNREVRRLLLGQAEDEEAVAGGYGYSLSSFGGVGHGTGLDSAS